MLVTVLVRMIVPVRVLMGMIVSATAAFAMDVFVMVMGTGLTMFMMVALRPVLVAVLVHSMIMIMIVAVRLAMTVGAALGIKRGQHGDHRGAKPLQHVFDDMIVADAQPVAEKLSRQMPITEMPGDTDELGRAGGTNLEKALGYRLHQDQPAILKLESVAVLHDGRFLEVEKEHGLADAPHHKAAAMTVITFESKRIGRRSGPGAGGMDASSGNHGVLVLADGGRDGWASLAKSAAEASAAAIKARPRNAAEATPVW